MAEGEALPDVDLAHGETAGQEVAHEQARRGLRELTRERDREQHRDAGFGEQALLLLGRRERQGDLLGPQHRERMGIEGDHHRGRVQAGGAGDDPLQDGPLAAVHAVEVADRRDAALRQVAGLVSVRDDQHRGGAQAGAVVASARAAGRRALTRRPTRSSA